MAAAVGRELQRHFRFPRAFDHNRICKLTNKEVSGCHDLRCLFSAQSKGVVVVSVEKQPGEGLPGGVYTILLTCRDSSRDDAVGPLDTVEPRQNEPNGVYKVWKTVRCTYCDCNKVCCVCCTCNNQREVSCKGKNCDPKDKCCRKVPCTRCDSTRQLNVDDCSCAAFSNHQPNGPCACCNCNKKVHCSHCGKGLSFECDRKGMLFKFWPVKKSIYDPAVWSDDRLAKCCVKAYRESESAGRRIVGKGGIYWEGKFTDHENDQEYWMAGFEKESKIQNFYFIHQDDLRL